MSIKQTTFPHFAGAKHRLTYGVVYKKESGRYTVHTAAPDEPGGETAQRIICSLASNLRNQPDPLAVGDRVGIYERAPGEGAIVEILERENRLSRRAPASKPGGVEIEQVIVANVGQVVPVFAAAAPTPHWNMLDRYLVTAEAFHLPVLICITKLDLAREDPQGWDDLQQTVNEYRQIGYRTLMVSAFTGEGMDELKTALAGEVSVFLGKSGVGKTSLLNVIQPGLGVRVSAVSGGKLGKGRHTTTHMEMFPLQITGAVVDTPGVREFGLWDIDQEDLALCFPEMRPYVGQCKFGLGCRHDEEPGCAVRTAVMKGLISPRRYHSYMRLKDDA